VTFAAFVRLSRLKFLAGGLLGGGLGTAIAAFEGRHVDWPAYALAQSAVSALQLMTHYANDYYDRETDAGGERTPFSGGSGALVDGTLHPRAALAAAGVCAAAGLAAGVALLATGRSVAGFLTLTIAVLAWAYSAPPLRFLARGLGEIDAMLVVAVLVPLCTYAAQAGNVDLRAMASALPAAGAMFAMMIAVEVPDVAADAATGKRTLVVRFGRDAAACLAGAGVLAGALGLALAVAYGAPVTLVPLAAVAGAAALRLIASMRRRAWTQPGGNAEIAARGATLFVVTSLTSLLGYAVALP
jgi:1,4-dihydroxy-2-naphthoate octaprenyltransferase